MSAARNIGIDHASGAYIVFLDADDIMLPHALETLYADITANKCDIAACANIACSSKKDLNNLPKTDDSIELWSGDRALQASLESSTYTFAVWAKMFSRAIIGSTRFIEGRKINEDSYFLFQCLKKSPRCGSSYDHLLLFQDECGSLAQTGAGLPGGYHLFSGSKRSGNQTRASRNGFAFPRI